MNAHKIRETSWFLTESIGKLVMHNDSVKFWFSLCYRLKYSDFLRLILIIHMILNKYLVEFHFFFESNLYIKTFVKFWPFGYEKKPNILSEQIKLKPIL